jgi:hypothetical protein
VLSSGSVPFTLALPAVQQSIATSVVRKNFFIAVLFYLSVGKVTKKNGKSHIFIILFTSWEK